MILGDVLQDTRKVGDCWEWTGRCIENGYGIIIFQGRREYVHRVVAYLMFNEWPGEFNIGHTCNNHKCVNPQHLVIRTREGSYRNAVRKDPKRSRKGERNPGVKLTAEQVRKIREGCKTGDKTSQLASEFGVNRRTISDICKCRSWSWLD